LLMTQFRLSEESVQRTILVWQPCTQQLDCYASLTGPMRFTECSWVGWNLKSRHLRDRLSQYLGTRPSGNWSLSDNRSNLGDMSPQNFDQQISQTDEKPVNQLRRDGFAAITIALISAVLIFVMFNHFVS
jgi:hypothetical protein